MRPFRESQIEEQFQEQNRVADFHSEEEKSFISLLQTDPFLNLLISHI